MTTRTKHIIGFVFACIFCVYGTQANNINEKVGSLLTPESKKKQTGHSGAIFWFTGLSGAGKSTIARLAEKSLFEGNQRIIVLDGDGLRTGLNSDLGFSQKDREENIRRVREIAKYLASAGNIVITSLISPYEKDREAIQSEPHGYVIYIKAGLDDCKKRDPKGLYKKVEAGLIKEFTGISSPFEEPRHPDLVIDTTEMGTEEATEQLLKFIAEKTR